MFGLGHGNRPVDVLEAGGDLFSVFPGHGTQGIAHHVNDTELDLGFRKDGGDRLRKTGQAIDTGDEHIFDAPIFEFGQDGEPFMPNG